jgi:antitoxin HicB
MEYCAEIKFDKEDKAWNVEFPDHPNINTFGDSLEHALYMAEDALNGVLEFDLERGQTIPKASVVKGKDVYKIPVAPHIALAYDLKSARADKPQKEIAGILGISYQAYQRFENPRKSNPSVKTLEKVARVLGKRLELRLV